MILCLHQYVCVSKPPPTALASCMDVCVRGGGHPLVMMMNLVTSLLPCFPDTRLSRVAVGQLLVKAHHSPLTVAFVTVCCHLSEGQGGKMNF